MIDADGFRFNVGIILCNAEGKVFWAKRNGQDAWQFPQGGIRVDETPKEALFRELFEEIGLRQEHVQIMGCTRKWLYYRLPHYLVRRNKRPLCIGQKQIWFSLRLIGSEEEVRLNMCEKPEFDRWRWVNYWYPLKEVVFFKRRVYAKALRELAPFSKNPATALAPVNPRKGGLSDPLLVPLNSCCSARINLIRA
jgi:putative (di)nucleoside polyphosphate hydrolase